jgi:multiple sugar transport system permease protein
MATVHETTTPARRTAGQAPGPRGGYRTQKLVRRLISYFILVFITLLMILPLLWMLSTSLKPKSQLFARQIEWIPRTVTLANYESLFANRNTPIARWFANSVFVATAVTALILLIDAMAAYAYARLEFPGRKLLFGLLLVTLFFPGVMFLIPNFLTIYRMGLLNNYAGVIIPGLAGVFGVFFLRQFFESLPRELEEAAEIDGANRLQIFFGIALPLAKPALATLGIITFLGSWNDFLWPLLILKDRLMQTLPPGLRTLQGAYTSEYGLMMAGAVVVAIPVLLLYIALQRYIVASVATSGLKG